MIEAQPLAQHVAFQLGPVPITRTVVTTWGLMALIGGGAFLAMRRLRLHPGGGQVSVELLVGAIADQIGKAMGRKPEAFLPLLGTLFIFVAAANLSGGFPGVSAPTAHLETTAALAAIVFFAVHAYGIRHRGLKGHLAHYLKPNALLLPLHLLSELTRTLSLAVRLFGNIMSHELVIATILALAGLFVPVPIMALGLLIGLVQAYIFTVLAAVYLGAAVGPSPPQQGE